MIRTLVARIAVLVSLVGASACDSTPALVNPDQFVVTYAPDFATATFVSEIDNPFYPLTPGTTYIYEGLTTDGSTETIVVEVTADTRVVAGVTAIVVRDQAFLDGELIEDTEDWFARDDAGNVWYLGEATEELEGGVVVSTAGSWEAGVDGAVAGIYMPAVPAVGQAYYQEFYAGEAEDRAEVLSTTDAISVPTGDYTGCVKTLDGTSLDLTILEHKVYCPGVGNVSIRHLDSNEVIQLVEIINP